MQDAFLNFIKNQGFVQDTDLGQPLEGRYRRTEFPNINGKERTVVIKIYDLNPNLAISFNYFGGSFYQKHNLSEKEVLEILLNRHSSYIENKIPI